MAALMAAEDLALDDWEWRLPGLYAYLRDGEGSTAPEQFVAQAQALSQPAPAGAQAYAV